jgi:hypothetical protein
MRHKHIINLSKTIVRCFVQAAVEGSQTINKICWLLTVILAFEEKASENQQSAIMKASPKLWLRMKQHTSLRCNERTP